jgi:hypothetical protein
MSIGGAAIAFLTSVGSPQKMRTIADALEADGAKSTDTCRAIYYALDNSDEADIDEMKRWFLKKWSEG